MPDPTTQSNYLQVTSEHVALDWTLDFDAEVIAGSAVHHLLVKEDNVKEVMLVLELSPVSENLKQANPPSFDTADLDISDVEISGKSTSVSNITYYYLSCTP
jgi:leukotriene-A4 hydrolase